MKMSATLIIGVVLILLGVSALIKVFFDIDIPLFKIAFAGLLIYIGIRILTGNSFSFQKERFDENLVIFGERTITSFEDGKEYNTIFGSALYDFNYAVPDSGTHARIKVNTIFGSSKIRLNRNLNVRVKSNTVFGGTSLPNGDQSAFGSSEYNNSAGDSSAYLTIESNTIFGGLKVLKNEY